MSPNDPRHGTYAGAQAHMHANEPLCDPCANAKYLYAKRMRMRLVKGRRHRIPLGREAWEILSTQTATQLSKATGMDRNMLYRLKAGGPDKVVLRSTRDRILGAEVPWTTIGVQRRARALVAIGYSATGLARRFGCHRDALLSLVRDGDRQFVRHEFAKKVVDLYDELHMTPAPRDRVSARMIRDAAERGFAPPLAWDDIDDPDERPNTGRKGYRNALAEYEWLTSCGESHEQAIKRLGVTEDAIEQAKRRARREREAA